MNNNSDSVYVFALCCTVTGVLNGLKKMVGKGTPEVDENHLITSTPDFSTPCVKSDKKRKASEVAGAFSNKKKFVIFYFLHHGCKSMLCWLCICKYDFLCVYVIDYADTFVNQCFQISRAAAL